MTREPPTDLEWAIATLAHTSRLLERDCEQAGLTIAQYRMLNIARHEPVRAGALAARVAISKPNLTTAIDTLEARGLIRRHPAPGDRRGVVLDVTDAGFAALREAETGFAARLSDLLSPRELERVADGFGCLREALLRHAERVMG